MDPEPHGMKRGEPPVISPNKMRGQKPYVKNVKRILVKATLLSKGHKREEDLPPYENPNTLLSQEKMSFDAQFARVEEPCE